MSTDAKDWFYCCATHLLDTGFAVPVKDEAAERERLKKEAVAQVKAEYDAKEARKLELKKEMEREKEEKEKPKSWLSMANPFSGSSSSSSSSTPSTKTESAKKAAEPSVAVPSGGAVEDAKDFSLHRTLFQHRCNLKQQAAQEKARQAQWQTLTFPSAPTK